LLRPPSRRPAESNLILPQNYIIRPFHAFFASNIIRYHVHRHGRYSALAQANEAGALELLEEHNALLRPIFPKHDGTEIKAIGDAFLVSSIVRSRRCAGASRFRKRCGTGNGRDAGAEKIEVRIGIHIGDVVEKDDDIFGDGVNIAARLYPLARPGGICISEDVARQVVNKIGYPCRKLEVGSLKNISAPMEVHALSPVAPRSARCTKTQGKSLTGENPRRSRMKPVLPAAASVLLLGVALYFVHPLLFRTTPNRHSKTIAVLPFLNLSGSADDEYLQRTGMTDDILTHLCRIAELNVISRRR